MGNHYVIGRKKKNKKEKDYIAVTNVIKANPAFGYRKLINSDEIEYLTKIVERRKEEAERTGNKEQYKLCSYLLGDITKDRNNFSKNDNFANFTPKASVSFDSNNIFA